MHVALIITEAKQCSKLLPWANAFAEAKNAHLMVIIPQKEKGDRRWKMVESSEEAGVIASSVWEAAANLGLANPGNSTLVSADEKTTSENPSVKIKADDFAHSKREFSIRILCDKDPKWALVEEINKLDVSLLVLPEILAGRTDAGQHWQFSLYENAPCDAICLRGNAVPPTSETRVLAIVNGDVDDHAALAFGGELTHRFAGTLTAAFVEPNIDVMAEEVGHKILNRIVSRALGNKKAGIEQKVQVSNSLTDGISRLVSDSYDLIIVGTRWRGELRTLFRTIKIDDDGTHPAVSAMRRGEPFVSRMWNRVRQFVEHFVPQLDRDQRISLVERIQASSQWNFDFLALIFLSTLIAALGLLQNSAAVVIGAMLVAPLMTPIVGAGLGIAQSNIQLIKVATRTVFLGFATAICIGFLLGLMAGSHVTDEMTARELPNFRDLVIALASGIAAAYAMGRPNLLSALPGVAIAAALVPPVATAGLGAALGEWHLALGALILFSTNIVAIIMGTAFTFWAIGLTRRKKSDKRSPSWPRWVFMGLVVATIVLTAALSVWGPNPNDVGNSAETRDTNEIQTN